MKKVIMLTVAAVVAASGAMAGDKISTSTANKYAQSSSAAGSCDISVKRHGTANHLWDVNTNCLTLDGAKQNDIFVLRTDQLFALENQNGDAYIKQNHPIMREYREIKGWDQNDYGAGQYDNPMKPLCFVCGWTGAIPA